MKIVHILILTMLPVVSFAGDGFVIEGKVTGLINGTVWLEDQSINNKQSMPEKVKIVNGVFKYAGKLERPALLRLHISTKVILVFMENTRYTVAAEFSKLVSASLKGGAINDQYVDYMSKRTTKIEGWIESHPVKLLSPFLAWNYFKTDYEKSVRFYNMFSPEVKQMAEAQWLAAKLKEKEKTLAGTMAPEFTVTTPDGKTLSKKDLAGKTVVIDFWASWCAPCRMFIPELKQLYETNKRADLVFLSISVDESDEKWRKAMEEEKMPWQQAISAEAFQENGLRKSFGFDFIPHLVVIGKDGRISANLNFYKKEQLQQELDKLK